MTSEQLRSAIGRAVEEALERRTAGLDALNETVLASQGILTAHAVGRLMGVSARTVKEAYVKQGLIVYRPGSSPLFLTKDVRAFVEAHPDSRPEVQPPRK